jgi:ArsR family transcriptional regulator
MAKAAMDTDVERVEALGRGGGHATAHPEVSDKAERLAAFGDALADPLRIRVLGLLAEAKREGRGCCGIPAAGAPRTPDHDPGVCVCELEAYFGLAQSKISYHLRKLVRAGLVREEKRGRWNFYSLNEEAVAASLSGVGEYLRIDHPE